MSESYFTSPNKDGKASLDLTIDTISLFDEKQRPVMKISEEGFALKRNKIYKVTIKEKINITSDSLGIIDGRSSIARCGIFLIPVVESTTIQPGENIAPVIYLSAIYNTRIYPNMKIAQLFVRKAFGHKEFKEPLPEGRNIGDPISSPNMYLDDKLYIYNLKNSDVLDTRYLPKLQEIIIPADGLDLEPYQLYLSMTSDDYNIGNFICRIDYNGQNDGWNILPWEIHSAPYILPGFHGKIALEISPVAKMRVYPHMRVGSLSFLGCIDKTIKPYKGKYNKQKTPENKEGHISGLTISKVLDKIDLIAKDKKRALFKR